MSALGEWVLSAALFFAPIETRPKFEGYDETRDEALARYASIAEDIAEAAEKGAGQGMSAKDNAALLLAVAIGESGLSLDVDRGPCYRKGGYKTRCDSGSSYTLWQMKTATVDGVPMSARNLVGEKNRSRAARGALTKLRGSIGMCGKLKPEDRLSAYGTGRCVEGHKSIRARWALYLRVLGHVAKGKDA